MKKSIVALLLTGIISGAASAQSVSSANIVGYVKVELMPGFTAIRTPFLDGPSAVDIQDLMDTTNLNKGGSLGGADNILMWDAETQRYLRYFLHDGVAKGTADKAGKWVEDSTGQIAVKAIAPGEALFFSSRSDESIEVVLSGDVVVSATRTNEFTVLEGFNAIANPFSSEWQFNDGSIDWISQGATAGGSLGGADNIVFWDAGSQRYVRYFLHDGVAKGTAAKAGKWVEDETGLVAENLTAKLPQGFFYYRALDQGHAVFEIEQPYTLD